MECDVLVVGAGPAGSMAAKTSAEKGLSTILIEKKKVVGSPVQCAEGINESLFRNTGIKKNKLFIRQKIKGAKIYFYDEIYHLVTDQWRGYTIDRKVFDKYIAQQSADAGANVLLSTKAVGMKKSGNYWIVRIKSERQYKEIKTKIVIGADGFGCNIGKYAGIMSKWKPDEFSNGYNLEMGGLNIIENDVWHIAFGEEFPQGYAWVFPKGKKCANVGVAIKPGTNIKKSFEFFISKYPNIYKMIGNNYSILEARGGCVPTSGPRSLDETIADGIILVGDAAGIVDPITGEGINSSMISGIASAETAVACIEKNSWGKDYLSEFRQRWMNKRYIISTLGEEMELLLQLKEPFYKAFTNKNISKKVRENFIAQISDK